MGTRRQTPPNEIALDGLADCFVQVGCQIHDGKLSRSEIKDGEVLDRFYRMDLNQDGVLDQHEWERHAEVFSRAQNSLLAIKPSGAERTPGKRRRLENIPARRAVCRDASD